MSPKKMIGLSFAASAAKLYGVINKLSDPCTVQSVRGFALFTDSIPAAAA